MKNVLVICPKFYSYHEDLVSELQKRFESVNIYYDDLRYHSYWLQCLYYLKLYYVFNFIYFHLNAVWSGCRSYDTLLVIKGSDLDQKWLDKLIFKRKIYYTWDSVSRFSTNLSLSYFDKVFTFDEDDARLNGWSYLPVFLKNSCFELKSHKRKKKTVLYVGGYSNDRYTKLRLISERLEKYGFIVDFRLFSPLKYIRKSFNRKHDGANPLVIGQKIPHHTYQKMLAECEFVLELGNPQQGSATQRVNEGLLQGAKVLHFEDSNLCSAELSKYLFHIDELCSENFTNHIDIDQQEVFCALEKLRVDKWMETLLCAKQKF